MRKEYLFISALILFALALFGFGSGAASALQAALRGQAMTPGVHDLTASIAGVTTAGTAGGWIVPVYSQYPLNLKNQLSIAAGAADGIAAGDAVLADGYFVGIIEKVFEHSAVVQTVFDHRFQAPVRIGASGADALLRGGSDPTLTLIASGAAVAEGDIVYTAANGMPYGSSIGTLHGLHDAGDKVFRESSLAIPYHPGSLEAVLVIPSPRQ